LVVGCGVRSDAVSGVLTLQGYEDGAVRRTGFRWAGRRCGAPPGRLRTTTSCPTDLFVASS
jgi:rhodanese-related sulfurtransferase